MKADVVLGLVFGDEAKSKVVNSLLKSNKYTHTLRFNGGANAGHTIYHEGKKVITHSIPTGAVSGVRSIIGPGCVINEKNFFQELENLSLINPNIHSCVKIASNAHVVMDKHIQEELEENKIGTTKRGIGPAYRDKYARVGVRAEEVPAFQDYLVNIYEEFHNSPEEIVLLCEGAQAIGLDVDWGRYPYVTSSHCGVGAVLNNGVPYQAIREVVGVGKCYDTYVGAAPFQDLNDPYLAQLAEVGEEFGATTGRLRQTQYLNLDYLKRSINLSGVSKVILNKLDVVREVNIWKCFWQNKLIDCRNEESFISFIKEQFPNTTIIFSESPYHI